MHAGLDTQNFVGERNFQCIPLTHMTGERVCAIMPLARGGTLVPRPIYNKYTFAKDLSETNCQCAVATASFYLTSVRQGVISLFRLYLPTKERMWYLLPSSMLLMLLVLASVVSLGR